MTTATDFSLAEAGLPTEREIEALAGSLFTDFDAGLCANGIEGLVTEGDTTVIERAAQKTQNPVASYNPSGIDSYEGVVQSLVADYAAANGTAQANEPAASSSTTPEAHTPVYKPTVLSQAQAEKEDKHGSNPKTESGTEDERLSATSGHTLIGTKTLEQIRADFPILRERVNGNPLVWFDNGATTQRPRQVIDRLVYYYEHENSNVHRGVHELADRSTDAMEKARQTVADFIGAPSAENIVFVRGTTEAINLVANASVKQYLKPGDEIIVTLLEHHANIVPWQLVAEETGAVIKVAPIDKSGQIILSEFEKLFTPQTRFASVTQVSNALGTITPVAEMIQIAHRHGVRILIDGAQSVAHLPVNVSALDADFFVFSGHKIYGPTGIGVVYGKKEVLEAARPYQGGGNMIRDVTFERTIYNEAPAKFEAGTAAIAQAVGLGAALEYVQSIGIEAISKWEHELTQYALGEMRQIPGLHLIGNATAKAGVLSFVLDGHDIFEVGEYLNRFGIAVRSGHHCAQPVLRHYGLEGTVRPTLAVYNSPEDVDAMVKALRSLSNQ